MNVNFDLYSKVSFGVKNKFRWGSPDLSDEENTKGRKELENATSLDISLMKDIGKLRAKHVSEVVLMFNSPEQIAAYVKELNQRVEHHDRTVRSFNDEEIEMARGIVTDITSLLDCKIDFKRLGIDPEDLTDDEAIEYGSKFAFWTTSLNGAPRNGRERPGVIRSANEFMSLVEELHPLYAAGEFKDIIPRLSPQVLRNDKRIQDAYDAEYARACIDYQKLPLSRKIMIREPAPKYSPIYGNLTRLEILREETVEAYKRAEETAKRDEYDAWLNNAIVNTL